MANSGIGFVYDKDNFINYVEYDLNLDHEANAIMGVLNVLGLDGILDRKDLFTLQLADTRKIDFSVSRRNDIKYHIVANGDFYNSPPF